MRPSVPTIEESRAWSISGGLAYLSLALSFVLIGLSTWAFIIGIMQLDGGKSVGGFLLAAGILGWLLAIFAWTSLVIVSPGMTSVRQFFGRYIGTVRNTGLSIVMPFSNGVKVSARVHNFETNELKVNDADGNPVNIAAIVVWRVADTAKAAFAVEDYEEFVHTQSESALRHVASTHPYDGADAGEISLRGGTEEVSDELAREVADRIAIAGLEIIEVRISSLAYAPEIAQAMLRRQQAAAVIAAREKIVEGSVTMVQDALARLEKENVVEMDDERRAHMVSNLLVVLCSEQPATPVVNSGTLYG
ncbi:SPFH domain-containing protein [Actinomycetaceae bacterium WB03_NA08]|uniref:SPFH domain-containing protein n=1 Tax=Scrofimicrobium canadense TaxID=2652290 RepID=A0A6N7VV75_9ACTO|nr:SPFH domain-containing protein [Scrofimicrobium canadense]MSS84890.1 SPFH domain-containing protein [Scrofimicrobium canadense]